MLSPFWSVTFSDKQSSVSSRIFKLRLGRSVKFCKLGNAALVVYAF